MPFIDIKFEYYSKWKSPALFRWNYHKLLKLREIILKKQDNCLK